jgi:hypothetical protein
VIFPGDRAGPASLIGYLFVTQKLIIVIKF